MKWCITPLITHKIWVLWALSCHYVDNCIDGLAQDHSNSSVLAMEILQSCAKPAVWVSTPGRPTYWCRLCVSMRRLWHHTWRIRLEHSEVLGRSQADLLAPAVGVVTRWARHAPAHVLVQWHDLVWPWRVQGNWACVLYLLLLFTESWWQLTTWRIDI